MNALEQLLRSFEREELEEITLASGGAPEGLTGGVIAPLGDDVWGTDDLLGALVSFGGSRHVEELSATPRQWTARVAGLGVISVSATQTGDHVEARFRLTRREGRSLPPSSVRPSARPAEPADPGLVSPLGPPPFEPSRHASLKATPAVAPPPPPPPPPPPTGIDPLPPGATHGPSIRIDTPTRVHEHGSRSDLTPGPPRATLMAFGLEPPPPSAPPAVAGPGRGTPPPPPPQPFPPFGTAPSPLAAPLPFAVAPAPPLPPLPPRPAPPPPAPPPPPRPVAPPPPPPPPAAPPPPPAPPVPAPLLAVPSLPPLAPPRPAPLPSKAAQKPAVSAPPPPTFEALLANARDANATDLHLIAGRPPLHRVAGELRPGGPVVAADALERMILPKVPPRLSAALAEGGSCDFALASLMHGRFRVNVSRQQTGLKVCLRVVSKELPTVESLRLPEEVAAAADQAQGLVLFTGPAGQGKTTTMSAVVDRLNEAAGRHIIAVDDPVEHLHLKKAALLSQREVGTHTASFVAALKAALREDPDVIVVGELHDVEVARLALAASQTGRLVLATMSTGGPACAIDRLLELFPLREQPHVRRVVAAALRLVVGQRLVPGRDGRSVHAAFEVLATTPSLAGLIRDGATTEIVALRQGALTPGSLRLDRSLAELVADDRVTLEAARGVAESPGDLDAALDELRAAPR